MGQHDKNQVTKTTRLETIAPGYIDRCYVLSQRGDRYGLSWDYRADARTQRLGLRLQFSYAE